MQHSTGSHCVFELRSHIVWSTKDRYKALQCDFRLRVPDTCRQVCRENGVDIIRGVLSSDHVHMFMSVPPKFAISDHRLGEADEGRSPHKVQCEFPQLNKRNCGQRFSDRGYFSTTNGALTEDIVLQYLERHIAKSSSASR